MASQSRETRCRQMAEWEVKLQQRMALLKEQGIDDRKIARDTLAKAFKAKIRESQVRLRAIDASDKRTADLAAVKAERLAKPKEEPPKSKKATEPPPEVKPKKKKKKEAEGQSQQG